MQKSLFILYRHKSQTINLTFGGWYRTNKLKINININKIKTPLNKGDIVGNISIGNRLEYIYIASDVKKANIFELYIKYLKNMFSL